MTTFKVTWPSGVEETEQVSDCATLEQYAMRRWGAATVAEVNEHGVSIELLNEDSMEARTLDDSTEKSEFEEQERLEFADFQRKLAEQEAADAKAAQEAADAKAAQEAADAKAAEDEKPKEEPTQA